MDVIDSSIGSFPSDDLIAGVDALNTGQILINSNNTLRLYQMQKARQKQ
ncbi:hypothetical protein ABER98_12045 [Domibacillus aminovorans]